MKSLHFYLQFGWFSSVILAGRHFDNIDLRVLGILILGGLILYWVLRKLGAIAGIAWFTVAVAFLVYDFQDPEWASPFFPTLSAAMADMRMSYKLTPLILLFAGFLFWFFEAYENITSRLGSRPRETELRKQAEIVEQREKALWYGTEQKEP